jgi:hypothetical protein
MKIALYGRLSDIGLFSTSESERPAQTSIWLPGPTSQRTISIAKHRFPIYLAYEDRGIGIVAGIAPIEPDERGIISSHRLKAKNKHDGWENPLKLAYYYRKLMEQGKTKAEIAGLAGVSRARVTQVINLLNLHSNIQKYLGNTKYNLDAKLLTERGLRQIAVVQDSDRQLRAFWELIC